MRRRDFIIGGLAALTAGPGIVHAKVDTRPRQISLHHTHTSESLDVTFSRNGHYSKSGLQQLNRFLRDFRTEEVSRIDPRLFDLLHQVKRKAGNPDGVFEIISAYRSPKTNQALRKKSRGVARKSWHMQGMALDVRLRGTSTRDLRDAAIALKQGGVGYYRRSDFVHLDTAQVRTW